MNEMDEQVLPAKISASGAKVVDVEGNEIVRPDVLNAVTNIASLAQLVKIRKSLERDHIEGRLDERTLSATGTSQYVDLLQAYPNIAYATVSFYNSGLDTVKISVNNPSDWSSIAINDTLSLDFTKADRRIEVIYYMCDPGNTATVTVKGKY